MKIVIATITAVQMVAALLKVSITRSLFPAPKVLSRDRSGRHANGHRGRLQRPNMRGAYAKACLRR